MPLLSLLADLSGLASEIRELRIVHMRVADALERLSPPPLVPPSESPFVDSTRLAPPPPDSHSDTRQSYVTVAESAEEHESRTRAEVEFGISLGFAPWSPQLQDVLASMRSDIKTAIGGSEENANEEADKIIRDAFREARAHENKR